MRFINAAIIIIRKCPPCFVSFLSSRREDFNVADSNKDGKLTSEEWLLMFNQLVLLYDSNGTIIVTS